ncbi:MAG TPA: phosphotransferase [Methanocella sp.]|uniref:phosphotransferase family protein n=1 Tax=Methanocella sp. TaxID=2052833 RepID=UPI002B58BD58|nr:phosphotransferase [Methanocella sp.]HTY90991.1 phosphotransferase [Methanocella sp.]
MMHGRSRLYHYVKSRRLADKAGFDRHPDLHVRQLAGSHNVYLVYDGRSHRKCILKSFGEGDRKSIGHMENEFKRLRQAGRMIGRRSWLHVARPLCKSGDGDFFVEEFVSGRALGDYMKEAMAHGRKMGLYEKLTMLAGFFALMHKKTERSSHVTPSNIRDELKKHARQASRGGAFTPHELKSMEQLVDKVTSYGIISKARKGLVHGDANPSNFLYDDDRLNVIDMERSGYRDPVYDLGMMAGELCHYAMKYGGDPYKADPFIGHLYWTYAGNFKDQHGTFIRLTKRNPLYMANSLLRIARHPFFSPEYKRRLAYHARVCLESLK